MRTVLDTILERGYWISQIALMLVALTAALAAFFQLRAFKLFELLKFLESRSFRKARRIVIRDIGQRSTEIWWKDPEVCEKWEKAASEVCAAYDILGLMIQYDHMDKWFPRSYGTFFLNNWARSIYLTHNILVPFLKDRRDKNPTAYHAFSTLAEKAEKLIPQSAKIPS
jgi:hypothetical protein